MAVSKAYQADVDQIIERKHDNGSDFWATPDGRWGVGSPFSTFDCAIMLSELGLPRSDHNTKGIARTMFASWQDDGRFRPAPKGAVYPCHSANAARALCRAGFARDRRLARTFEHLLENQHSDGGWRCNTVKPGRGPLTDASNPGVTLAALDAFRFTRHLNQNAQLDKAVRFLLAHWKTKRPLGPCEFGIGTLFMKVEFPFLRYNLFFYVYVLSFYNAAKESRQFRDALKALETKLVDGQIVVENPNRRLVRFRFCRKGEPSEVATRRYREILKNIGA